MKILVCDKCGDSSNCESHNVIVRENVRLTVKVGSLRKDIEEWFDLCDSCIEKISYFIKDFINETE